MAKLTRVRFADSVLAGAELVAAALEEVSFAGSDLAGADVSNARCAQVDLRNARLDDLLGLVSLKGSTIGFDQLVGLAPALALALGFAVRADDEPEPEPTPRPVRRPPA